MNIIAEKRKRKPQIKKKKKIEGLLVMKWTTEKGSKENAIDICG